jgi:hypothetical protein
MRMGYSREYRQPAPCRGILRPAHETARLPTRRHSGARRSREPGIHLSACSVATWIPGSTLARRPGMTMESASLATKLVCPSCQCVATRRVLPLPPNQPHHLRIPFPRRGAARDRHGRWERDAMDAMASGAIIARTNDADADGEVVWFWRPDAGAKVLERNARFRSDGGKRARSPGRARRTPLKPLRRDRRMFPVNLWLLTPVLFVAQAAAGPSDTRHSLRPLHFEGGS